MRRLLQLLGITTTILTGFVFPTHSQDLARVTHDRVNVCGGPSVNSEVIIHLQKDEQVAVVEIVRTNSAAVGENGDWAKIRLPSDTPVWVYAPFVDANGRVVRSERLNVRAGPGLNFSILGSLAKGAPISSIRTLDDWMEIEAPTNTFAFVSTRYLQLPEALKATSPAVTAKETPNSTPATPPQAKQDATSAKPVPVTPASETTTHPLTAALTPVPTTPKSPTPAAGQLAPAPTAVVSKTPQPTDSPVEARKKRIVRREGRVRPTVSIQAPTNYELRSVYGAVRLNYLLPISPTINIGKFKGQCVIVSGEEQIEPRWPNLPMIEVESIRLAP